MPTSSHRKGWIAARSKPKTAAPKRTRLRQTLRQRAALMHAMLADIGINPIYENAYGGKPRGGKRDGFHDRQWAKQAKAWLNANQKRFAVV